MEIKSGKIKKNHHKGIAAEHKAQKRAEAEARNKAYQALSFEEKLARQKPGGKVYKKLMAQKEQ